MDALSILLAIFTMAFIFFIPGYFTYSALRPNKNADLEVTYLEAILLPILVSVVITSWVSIVLTMLRVYSLGLLLICLLIYTLVIAVVFRRKIKWMKVRRPVLDKKVLFVVLLVIVAVVLFFQPFEELFGYGDGYIEFNIGGMIARNGSVRFNDPLVASLPADVMSYFTFKDGQLFNSLMIIDYSTGEVAPSFLHLYATWLAIFQQSVGVGGALYATPILSLISLVTIFALTKELFDWRTAALASSILVLSFLQIWFSRSHSAEMLLQLLIVGGVLTFVLFRRSRNQLLGVVSALCFGLTLFTKIEAGLLLIPFFLFFTGLNVLGKLDRTYFAFVLPFAASLAIAFEYYIFVTPGYGLNTFFASDVPQEALVGVLIIAVAVNLIPRKQMKKIGQMTSRHIRRLQQLAVLFMLAYIFYCIFTLPTETYGYYGWNLELLSLYMTPVVVILGLFGMMQLTYRKPNEDVYFFLGIMLVFFFFFVSNIHHGWGGPWWMRRFIFAVVPLLVICAAYSVFHLAGRFKPRARKGVALLLIASMILPTIAVSSPILGYVEYRGEISQTEEIFQSFNDDSVLVFADASYPHIAYPLREIYGLNALVLRRDYWGVTGQFTNSTSVEKFMQAYDIWAGSGKTVFVISPSQKFMSAFDGELTFTLYKTGRIDMPYLELSMSDLPSQYTRIFRYIEIYSVSR